MSVQQLNINDGIEEENEEDIIPEEGNNDGQDTAGANLQCYNSELLTNKVARN